eukprot:537625-Amphidinium_carterae.1
MTCGRPRGPVHFWRSVECSIALVLVLAKVHATDVASCVIVLLMDHENHALVVEPLQVFEKARVRHDLALG